MKDQLQAIIMAAGRSSRFKTNRSKLIEKICGQEMILYSTKLLEKLKIHTSVIVGYQKEEVQKVISKQHGNKISFIEQKEQKGTAHALMCTKEAWFEDHILIMNADMPLVCSNLLTNLWQSHLQSNAAVSLITAHNLDPSLDSYGKVISENNEIKIIEAKDYQQLIAKDPSKKTESCCINAGIYIFKRAFLEQAIHQLQSSSVTGEFYITDLIHIASKSGAGVTLVDAPVDQIRGINTLRELWIAEQIKQAEIINHWMNNGVRFQSAQNSYVDLNVVIGAGTCIGQGVQINGNSDIDENCLIDSFTIINNSEVGKDSHIQSFSIIKDSHLPAGSIIESYTSMNSSAIIKSQNFDKITRSGL
jgi:bifunctional UDP-N-acetylglucosamine pyrophosphorylase/glucosamine-1-phosphate N-acetyltransferase